MDDDDPQNLVSVERSAAALAIQWAAKLGGEFGEIPWSVDARQDAAVNRPLSVVSSWRWRPGPLMLVG